MDGPRALQRGADAGACDTCVMGGTAPNRADRDAHPHGPQAGVVPLVTSGTHRRPGEDGVAAVERYSVPRRFSPRFLAAIDRDGVHPEGESRRALQR